MRKILNKTVLKAILAILLFVSLVANLVQFGQDAQNSIQFVSTPETSYVYRQLAYIAGSIRDPGIYQISQDTRISELIEMAGGLTEEADTTKLEKEINLAKKLEDGEKVYIPSINSNANTTTINLNSATTKELEKLPGIGPVTAAKIIEIRPIKNLNDLAKIKGLSSKKISELIELVSL